MEDNISLFKEYKLLYNLMYPDEPLKKWLNKDNVTNHYKNDWNVLMPVVEKIEELGYFCMINKWTSVYKGSKEDRIQVVTVEGNTKLKNTYKAVTIFIEWYNENKK